VQFASYVAQPLAQCTLDVHVDVFQLDLEREVVLLNFLADTAQGLLNLLAFRGGDKPDLRQHLGVSDRGGDVVRIKAAIEAHTFSELFDPFVGRLAKYAAPSLRSHSTSQVPREWAKNVVQSTATYLL